MNRILYRLMAWLKWVENGGFLPLMAWLMLGGVFLWLYFRKQATWQIGLWLAVLGCGYTFMYCIERRKKWHRYLRFALIFALVCGVLELSAVLMPPNLMDALVEAFFFRAKPDEYYPMRSPRRLIIFIQIIVLGTGVFLEFMYWAGRLWDRIGGLKRLRGTKKDGALAESDWIAGVRTRDGYPVVAWREDVPTQESIGQALDRMELRIAGGMLVGGGLIGLFVGDWSGALIGLLIALFFMPAVSRRSVAPTLQNVGGYVPMPGPWGRRDPTVAEQRSEAGTVTEPWETQALIELRDGEPFAEQRGGEVFVGPREEPYFIVRTRRAGSTGVVSVRIDVPWDAIRDFRLESEQETYQARTQVANIADYSVINVYARGLGVGVVGHFPVKADGVRIMEQILEHFSPDAFRDYQRKRLAGNDRPQSTNGGPAGSTIPDKLLD